MLFYLAPMEGITGYIVRNAYAHYFPYIDKSCHRKSFESVVYSFLYGCCYF